MYVRLSAWIVLAAALAAGAPLAANAQTGGGEYPFTGARTVTSSQAFEAVVARLETAIEANKMGLVAQASASRGAAARGVKIRGNAVLMVFRNDYAVRMLAASVPAGIEAPLRLYITEDRDGRTSVTWRSPSAVFAPYGSADLNALARELDPIFEKIVRDAAGN
ncbi:MAG: DUF302 domain-containing protein [Betaproteobacteria bacterium]|nr:DUF302 domain-containing protein [Betaproteobacteria bacterium]